MLITAYISVILALIINILSSIHTYKFSDKQHLIFGIMSLICLITYAASIYHVYEHHLSTSLLFIAALLSHIVTNIKLSKRNTITSADK